MNNWNLTEYIQLLEAMLWLFIKVLLFECSRMLNLMETYTLENYNIMGIWQIYHWYILRYISDLAAAILMKPKRISTIGHFHNLLKFNGKGCPSQIFNFTKQSRYSPERKLITFLDNPELLRMEIACCLTSWLPIWNTEISWTNKFILHDFHRSNTDTLLCKNGSVFRF